ncbi:MAG: aminotransferase class I/II-fold pyridoxal phosphate-dependent enzyme [Pseudomonadota bacterium]
MPDLSNRIRRIVSGGDDGWGLYYRAREMMAAGTPVVMLSIGDHDIKTDPSILAAMQRSAEGGHLGYTGVSGLHALRQAIADRVTRRTMTSAVPENVVICPGGQGSIFASMSAMLDPGDACIILDPFYATFDVTVRAAAGEPIIVPTIADEGFQPDPDLIAAAITPKTRAILVNTPNNPSGAVYKRDRLEAIADLCRQHDLWVISDELYDGQIHNGEHISLRDLPDMVDRTFVIGSMSKGYAMTGSRIGWAIAPAEAAARMIDLAGATTYGLPGFIQDAALYALTECSHLEAEVAERYRRRRDIAVEAIGPSQILSVVPPDGGMYVMLDVRGTGLSGEDFGYRLLEEEHIAVMPGESFGKAAAGHVRIALTVADDALGDAMSRIAKFADRLV